MTDRGRLIFVRLILIVALLRSVLYLFSYQSGIDTGLVLGRYTPRYFAVLVLGIIASIGLGIFLFLPVFKRLVLANQVKRQWFVLGGWLLIAPLVYALIYWLEDTPRFRVWWNGLVGFLFPLLTLALICATWNAVREVIRRPEFYLALVSTVIGLVLVEFGLRVYINRMIMPQDPRRAAQYLPSPDEWRTPRFTPHQYELYIPNPLWRSEDGQDQVNSLGFRGEEVSVPKPPGVFRIVAIGGSTTYGTGVESWEDSYPAQLEQVLTEDYGYTNVEVVNAGVGGQNSWEALVNLEFRVLDLQPDLIILYQNTNDVHARLVKPDTYRGDNSGERTVWDPRIEDASHGWWSRVPSALWRFVGLNFGWFEVPSSLELEDLVTKPCTGFDAFESCLGVTPAEALADNPPIYYERNIRNMIAISEVNGADFLLVTWAYTTAYHDYSSWDYYQAAYAEQNEVMQTVADDTGVFLYDFSQDMPTDIAYWVDGRHLNPQGNRLKAELIGAYIHDMGIVPRQ